LIRKVAKKGGIYFPGTSVKLKKFLSISLYLPVVSPVSCRFGFAGDRHAQFPIGKTLKGILISILVLWRSREASVSWKKPPPTCWS